MLTEKQIYNRLNKVYETEFGDRAEDEWYGTDDPYEWWFYRPSEDTEYKLIMDEKEKRIDIYYMESSKETWVIMGNIPELVTKFRRCGGYSWKR